jgi:hypothetical protein
MEDGSVVAERFPEAAVMELARDDSDQMRAHHTHVGQDALKKAEASLPVHSGHFIGEPVLKPERNSPHFRQSIWLHIQFCKRSRIKSIYRRVLNQWPSRV